MEKSLELCSPLTLRIFYKIAEIKFLIISLFHGYLMSRYAKLCYQKFAGYL